MRQLLTFFPMRPVRCPSCRLRIDGGYVWTYRQCAACGARFRIRWLYFWTMYVLALIVCVGVAFAIGHRGNALASLALLLLLPTLWGMLMGSLRLFPPDIEIVVPGWTPGDSEADQEVEREFELLRELDAVVDRAEPDAPAAKVEESTDQASGPLPLSMPKAPPVSFEGIAIAIAFLALFAYHVYVAFEPFIRIGSTPTQSAAPRPPERHGR